MKLNKINESEYDNLEDADEFGGESMEIRHLQTLSPNEPLLYISDSEIGDKIYLGDLKSLQHLYAVTDGTGDLSDVGNFLAYYDSDIYHEGPLLINVQMEKREI